MRKQKFKVKLTQFGKESLVFLLHIVKPFYNLLIFLHLTLLQLKLEFPKKALVMPRKRWFGNNFSMSFIEDRIRGLQHFIDTVTSDEELLATITVRQFFCLDEPPAASEIGEESRVWNFIR